MLECLSELRERDGRAARDPARPAGARAGRAGPRHRRHASCTSAPTRGRSRARRIERVRAAVGIECYAHPGLHAVDELDARADGGGQAVHGVQPVSPQVARGAAPRRDRAAALVRLAAERRPGRADPVAGRARARAGGRGAAGGRRGGRARAPDPLPELGRRGPTPRTTTRSAATAARGCRPTCTSGASRRARSRRGCRAGRGRRSSGASSAGATSTTTSCSTSRATPAPSSRSATAARSAGAAPSVAFARLARGPDRLPARRRRDAPAAHGGLDAQPRPARGRLVLDQGPGHRLALGRALVHAAADRRRRGQQQRQLAVDRVGRGRPAAVLPAPLQPGAPPGALRPGGRVRAHATCPSSPRCRTST